MDDPLMRTWKMFRQEELITLIILGLTLLSSLSSNSALLLQQKPVLEKTTLFPAIIPSDLPKPSNLKGYVSINPKSVLKYQIENVNETFEEIYKLVNPLPINSGYSGENVTIAILDSGINEVGWITNLVSQNTTIPNSTGQDDNGHGTLVGSIISKIAPNASLISIKISDSKGFTKTDWVEEGFKLALRYNVSIIHASLGTSDLEAFNSTIIANLSSKNVTTVISAGNNGPFASSLSSPAIFADIISVGMIYNQTHIPDDSSSGPRPSGMIGPDLVAPGVHIVGYDHNNLTVNKTGTSYAASFVTGALALLKQAFPEASPTTLKAGLLKTAYFMNNTSPIRQGNGILDISKAYKLLKDVNTTNPLFTFAPRELSSFFTYFGHAINGVNRTYRISLYSTTDSNLTKINTYQTLPKRNVSRELPFNVSVGILPRNITAGLNYIDISLKIPEDLSMAKREGNVTFQFSNGAYSLNLSITIENRYPGGNILFYQGYDNDSFIPDGPTGRFSQLQHFLESYYGMNTLGAIRPNGLISAYGPLIKSNQVSGGITQQDLDNQHILVLADIEWGISDQEITLIQEWVAEGHSLLVLSFPSRITDGTETLSNQTAINKLLEPYGFSIENDFTDLSRFRNATTSVSDPIFEERGWEFDYVGTSIGVSTEKGGKILATAVNQLPTGEEDYNIAGYWEDSKSKGKVIVFGGMLPFSDLGITTKMENLDVITRVFRWMIQDQQLSLDVLPTYSPTVGGSTQIQITFNNGYSPNFPFNGTIMESNGSFSQIMFIKSINMYKASWKPLSAGHAVLWLNLVVSGKAPTNGVYIFEVLDSASPDMFFLFIIGGFVLLGVVFYILASRRPQKRSPIEQRVALDLQKQKFDTHRSGLETSEKCSQCQITRHTKESKYCFKCGKEL